MIRAILRRLLKRVIIFSIQRRGIALGMATVLVVGGVAGGFLMFSTGQARLAVPTLGGPPSAPEMYLKGTQNYDASLVWSAFSQEAQERFRSRGGSELDLQRQLDAARQQGSHLERFFYIGGQTLPDGRSMQFYLVVNRGNLTRGEAEYVPYVFTLDKDGKILKVQ